MDVRIHFSKPHKSPIIGIPRTSDIDIFIILRLHYTHRVERIGLMSPNFHDISDVMALPDSQSSRLIHQEAI